MGLLPGAGAHHTQQDKIFGAGPPGASAMENSRQLLPRVLYDSNPILPIKWLAPFDSANLAIRESLLGNFVSDAVREASSVEGL